MKKIFSAILLLLSLSAFSQAPQAFKYQGIARDNTGAILSSAAISIRPSIHDGSATGLIVYQETHAVTTNSLGLFNLSIGMGTPTVGTFSAINWSTGNKYMEIEVNFGSGYVSMGTSELLSVPYALYSASTGSTGQNVYEVYGTAQLVVSTATTTYTLIPGLTQTINIPANCKVIVSTDGGMQSTGATGSTYSVVDIGIFVDGTVSTSGGQRRLSIANTTALAQLIENWSMERTYTLAAGNHTFEVKAVSGAAGSASANVSSAAAPQLQGVLTVTVIKQ
ncbi:MAG: hypothetical protein ACXVPU_17700 [Bacteroidia bacterium]